MNKKIAALALVSVLTMTTFLAACGKSNENSGSSPQQKESPSANTEEKVTVRIMTRTAGTSTTVTAFQGLLNKFMEQNPNITVVDESLNDEAAFNNFFTLWEEFLVAR